MIRIPSPKNEATEFGSAVHYALEQLFRKMQDRGNETFPSKEILLQILNGICIATVKVSHKEQFDRRMEYGQEVLSNYYDKYINSFNKIVTIERNIRNVVVNGVPIKGKLISLNLMANR